MAFKVVTADKTGTSEFDSTEERQFELLFVSEDTDSSGVIVTAIETETQTTVTYKINTRRFDSDTKKWVADSDVEAEADRLCQEWLGYSRRELLANDYDDAATFSGYTDGETVRPEAFTPYIRFDRIDVPTSKKLAKATGPFEATAIRDNTNYRRYDLGVKVDVSDEGDGSDIKQFRVAQIEIEADDPNEPDSRESLKYTTKTIESNLNTLEESDFDHDRAAKIRKSINVMIDRARADKTERLNRVFGVDLQEMIENGQTFEFDSITVQSIGSGKDINFFLNGKLVTED